MSNPAIYFFSWSGPCFYALSLHSYFYIIIAHQGTAFHSANSSPWLQHLCPLVRLRLSWMTHLEAVISLYLSPAQSSSFFDLKFSWTPGWHSQLLVGMSTKIFSEPSSPIFLNQSHSLYCLTQVSTTKLLLLLLQSRSQFITKHCQSSAWSCRSSLPGCSLTSPSSTDHKSMLILLPQPLYVCLPIPSPVISPSLISQLPNLPFTMPTELSSQMIWLSCHLLNTFCISHPVKSKNV